MYPVGVGMGMLITGYPIPTKRLHELVASRSFLFARLFPNRQNCGRIGTNVPLVWVG
jgi:hypothetical protein